MQGVGIGGITGLELFRALELLVVLVILRPSVYQPLLFEYVSLFVPLIQLQPELCSALIGYIFRDNQRLVGLVDEGLVYAVVRQLQRSVDNRRKAACLQLLKQLLTCRGGLVKRNQNLVLDMLMQHAIETLPLFSQRGWDANQQAGENDDSDWGNGSGDVGGSGGGGSGRDDNKTGWERAARSGTMGMLPEGDEDDEDGEMDDDDDVLSNVEEGADEDEQNEGKESRENVGFLSCEVAHKKSMLRRRTQALQRRSNHVRQGRLTKLNLRSRLSLNPSAMAHGSVASAREAGISGGAGGPRTMSAASSSASESGGAEGGGVAAAAAADDTEEYEVEYYVALLQLLTSCTLEHNHHSEVQCRSLVSVSELCIAIQGELVPILVRLALVQLLDAVFVDVERSIFGLVGDAQVWGLLAHFTEQMAQFCKMYDAEKERTSRERENARDHATSAASQDGSGTSADTDSNVNSSFWACPMANYVFDGIVPLTTHFLDNYFAVDRRNLVMEGLVWQPSRQHLVICNRLLVVSSHMLWHLGSGDADQHEDEQDESEEDNSMRLQFYEDLLELVQALIDSDERVGSAEAFDFSGAGLSDLGLDLSSRSADAARNGTTGVGAAAMGNSVGGGGAGAMDPNADLQAVPSGGDSVPYLPRFDEVKEEEEADEADDEADGVSLLRPSAVKPQPMIGVGRTASEPKMSPVDANPLFVKQHDTSGLEPAGIDGVDGSGDGSSGGKKSKGKSGKGWTRSGVKGQGGLELVSVNTNPLRSAAVRWMEASFFLGHFRSHVIEVHEVHRLVKHFQSRDVFVERLIQQLNAIGGGLSSVHGGAPFSHYQPMADPAAQQRLVGSISAVLGLGVGGGGGWGGNDGGGGEVAGSQMMTIHITALQVLQLLLTFAEVEQRLDTEEAGGAGGAGEEGATARRASAAVDGNGVRLRRTSVDEEKILQRERRASQQAARELHVREEEQRSVSVQGRPIGWGLPIKYSTAAATAAAAATKTLAGRHKGKDKKAKDQVTQKNGGESPGGRRASSASNISRRGSAGGAESSYGGGGSDGGGGGDKNRLRTRIGRTAALRAAAEGTGTAAGVGTAAGMPVWALLTGTAKSSDWNLVDFDDLEAAHWGRSTHSSLHAQQCRLGDLGACSMVLHLVQYAIGMRGGGSGRGGTDANIADDLLRQSLRLGVRLLDGGNQDLQMQMLVHLQRQGESFSNAIVSHIRSSAARLTELKQQTLLEQRMNEQHNTSSNVAPTATRTNSMGSADGSVMMGGMGMEDGVDARSSFDQPTSPQRQSLRREGDIQNGAMSRASQVAAGLALGLGMGSTGGGAGMGAHVPGNYSVDSPAGMGGAHRAVNVGLSHMRGVNGTSSPLSGVRIGGVGVGTAAEAGEQGADGDGEGFVGDSNACMDDLLEFLRLLCEDHYQPMQQYMRETGILDEVIAYLRSLEWVVDPTSHYPSWSVDATRIDMACKVLETLIEFAQGCPGNQVRMCDEPLIGALEALLTQPYRMGTNQRGRQRRHDFIDVTPETCKRGVCSFTPRELKGRAVLLLFSLLEGNPSRLRHERAAAAAAAGSGGGQSKFQHAHPRVPRVPSSLLSNSQRISATVGVNTLRSYCGELLTMLTIGRRQRQMLLSMLPAISSPATTSKSHANYHHPMFSDHAQTLAHVLLHLQEGPVSAAAEPEREATASRLLSALEHECHDYVSRTAVEANTKSPLGFGMEIDDRGCFREPESETDRARVLPWILSASAREMVAEWHARVWKLVAVVEHHQRMRKTRGQRRQGTVGATSNPVGVDEDEYGDGGDDEYDGYNGGGGGRNANDGGGAKPVVRRKKKHRRAEPGGNVSSSSSSSNTDTESVGNPLHSPSHSPSGGGSRGLGGEHLSTSSRRELRGEGSSEKGSTGSVSSSGSTSSVSSSSTDNSSSVASTDLETELNEFVAIAVTDVEEQVHQLYNLVADVLILLKTLHYQYHQTRERRMGGGASGGSGGGGGGGGGGAAMVDGEEVGEYWEGEDDGSQFASAAGTGSGAGGFRGGGRNSGGGGGGSSHDRATQDGLHALLRDFERWLNEEEGGFLRGMVASIEINRGGRLERVHFQVPQICREHWHDPSIMESRTNMKYNLTSDNHIERLQYFHERGGFLLLEMAYSAHVAASSVKAYVSRYHAYWQWMIFGLTVLMNVINVSVVEIEADTDHSVRTRTMEDTEMEEKTRMAGYLILSLWATGVIIGLLHLVCSVLRLYAHVISRRQQIRNSELINRKTAALKKRRNVHLAGFISAEHGAESTPGVHVGGLAEEWGVVPQVESRSRRCCGLGDRLERCARSFPGCSCLLRSIECAVMVVLRLVCCLLCCCGLGRSLQRWLGLGALTGGTRRGRVQHNSSSSERRKRSGARAGSQTGSVTGWTRYRRTRSRKPSTGEGGAVVTEEVDERTKMESKALESARRKLETGLLSESEYAQVVNSDKATRRRGFLLGGDESEEDEEQRQEEVERQTSDPKMLSALDILRLTLNDSYFAGILMLLSGMGLVAWMLAGVNLASAYIAMSLPSYDASSDSLANASYADVRFIEGWRDVALVCYSFHFLHMLRDRYLQNVMKMVSMARATLTQIAVLSCVVVYIYGCIGWASFKDDYDLTGTGACENGLVPGGGANATCTKLGCRTLRECLATHFNYGLREDVGIAERMVVVDYLNAPFTYSVFRLLFDVSYWVIVVVMLLSIVSGVIIDSFGQLRDLTSKIDRDMERRCFVCGIDSNSFQRHSKGFEYHTHNEHSMWGYIFFRQYLQEKDPSHYTGQESFMTTMLQTQDLKFYPVGKALSLELPMGPVGGGAGGSGGQRGGGVRP
jgi:hypothetical protein